MQTTDATSSNGTTDKNAPAPRKIHGEAEIRGIPHTPYKYRWSGEERWVADPRGERPANGPDGEPARFGLPWPARPVRVLIVDNPEPFDPERNGGVPTEISPATLKMLKADRRIAVQELNAAGQPSDVSAAIAHAAKLEADLIVARRELAGLSEEHAKQRQLSEQRAIAAEREAATYAERIKELEAQLSAATARKGGAK